VIGHISAFRVIVAGKVEGNIAALERVELSHDCLVQGDISYGSINVQHGARLQGLIIQKLPEAAPAGEADQAILAIRKAQETAR
jgi:cytoskeletal protein CcmA (bactofilin family)